MKLIDTVPVREISGRVGEPLRHEREEGRAAAARRHPNEYALGAYLLLGMAGTHDPGALAAAAELAMRVPRSDPVRTVAFAEKMTRMRVFGEILSASGTTASGHRAYDVFLAELGGDFLYLGDVRFQDPAKPLRAGEPGMEGATHRGFGLFGEFLGNLERYAALDDRPAIALVAAGPDQEAFFRRHGFEDFFTPEEVGDGGAAANGRVAMAKWVAEVVERRKREMMGRTNG